MKTPVLLITFNRPDETKRVLDVILGQNPEEIFVFQDGPRKDNKNDAAACAEVRNVIEKAFNDIDGKVKKHFLFSERNFGCGMGPVTAISWFFDEVEQGIVFEDDCIPHPDFFNYCEELLDKYKDDERISFIGGCNFDDEVVGLESSYGFCSGHHETWGWASWRRSWRLMDYRLKDITKKDFRRILNRYFRTWKHKEYWWMIYRMAKKDQMRGSCWDYQYYFSCWKRNMMAIYPKTNLVSNVGFGENATHTSSKRNRLLLRESESIMPLKHPSKVVLDVDYDYRMLRYYDIPFEYGLSGLKRIPYRVNRWMKRVVNHDGEWFGKK